MSDGTTKTRYSLTETAKILRKCLKEAFPGVKFSVRGTRGGSIRVGWTDGPLSTAVETQCSYLGYVLCSRPKQD